MNLSGREAEKYFLFVDSYQEKLEILIWIHMKNQVSPFRARI